MKCIEHVARINIGVLFIFISFIPIIYFGKLKEFVGIKIILFTWFQLFLLRTHLCIFLQNLSEFDGTSFDSHFLRSSITFRCSVCTLST